MKTSRIVLYFIIGTIVLLYGVSFLLPSTYQVERKTVVKADYETVFPMISNLREHVMWSPWRERDSSISEIFLGEDGKPGSIYRWKGNDEVGEGEQEITAVRPDRVDMEVRFLQPFKTSSSAWLTIDTKDLETVEVKWGFAGKIPRPLNLMLLFTDFEQAIGKDYDAGLQKLKTLAEKRFESKDPFRDVVVQEVYFDPRYFVYRSLEATQDSELLNKVLETGEKLKSLAERRGLEIFGNLVLQFVRQPSGGFVVHVGFPFARYTALPGYQSGMLPDGEFYFAGIQLGRASLMEMAQLVSRKSGLEAVDSFMVDFLEYRQIAETGNGLVGVFVSKNESNQQ